MNTIKATAKQHSVAVTIVLDFIHVLEYVWKAAFCFHASGSEEAVLRIRALRASGDFDEYWEFHKLQEFKRNHVSKFQEPERLLAA